MFPALKASELAIDSVFRTTAWIESWLETYGRLKQIEIVDVLGNGIPQELFYRLKTKTLKVIPVKAIGLAGCQSPGLSSPRSEYNLPAFAKDNFKVLSRVVEDLKRSGASVVFIPDIQSTEAFKCNGELPACSNLTATAYQVRALSLECYLKSLGKNTRARFFNKYSRLMSGYEVEIQHYEPAQFRLFAALLNQFHLKRWGRPCYSQISIDMFDMFVRLLTAQGGRVLMEVLLVNGKPESVLFDVVWAGRRYNLQAGYNEYFNPQLKLGSLHIGKAIRESIESNLVYDMLAGQGKLSDYKRSLSTHQTELYNFSDRSGLAAFDQWAKEARRKWLGSK